MRDCRVLPLIGGHVHNGSGKVALLVLARFSEQKTKRERKKESPHLRYQERRDGRVSQLKARKYPGQLLTRPKVEKRRTRYMKECQRGENIPEIRHTKRKGLRRIFFLGSQNKMQEEKENCLSKKKTRVHSIYACGM